MKTIYKYAFEVHGHAAIHMPKYAEFLSGQNQDGLIALWYLVDTEMPKEVRQIYIFGTGLEIQKPLYQMTHLATVQIGSFVWHVFENTYERQKQWTPYEEGPA